MCAPKTPRSCLCVPHGVWLGNREERQGGKEGTWQVLNIYRPTRLSVALAQEVASGLGVERVVQNRQWSTTRHFW